MDKEIKIDFNSPVPIYEQIKQAVKMLIINGDYKVGERLISIRELAGMLKVNQSTILKAYYQMDVEGFIHSKPGQGYFVKERQAVNKEESEKLFNSLTDEFIHKVSSLGFTTADIISKLKERSHHVG